MSQNIVLERTYKAKVEELWELWTTKQGFESWWGPQGIRVDVKALDARVGGALHYDMIADSPEMVAAMKAQNRPLSHATRGTFAEVKRHERLAITHVIDFLPGVTAYENTIVVEFLGQGDRVRMKVTLAPMHTPELSAMQKEGFTSQLTKLDARFAD